MSSLREMLESRRGPESTPSHTCLGTEAQPACLIVTTHTGESWVFPWTQLAAAHFAKNDQREELRLMFTSHEVRLAGVNFTALRALVATLQLARVHPTPRKYHKTVDAEPFIEVVQVMPGNSSRASDAHSA